MRVLLHIEEKSKQMTKQILDEHQNKIFQDLPIELQKEIREQSNSNILSKLNILQKHFSQQTLDQLLFYVEEINYLPNQVIFEQNLITDSSIFLILEGSVGIFLGCKEQGQQKRWVNSQKEGSTFGEIGFFTGQARNVSALAMDYVRVGKICRQALLGVICKQEDDLERFCMLRDQFLLYEEDGCFGVSCESCGKSAHQLIDCPLTHSIYDKGKIIHRHIYSADQFRHPIQRRKSICRKPKGQNNPFVILKQNEEIQKMLRLDTICLSRLNALTEQLNFFEFDDGVDEENEEEEDEEEEDDNAEEDNDILEEDQTPRSQEEEYSSRSPKLSDQDEECLKTQITKQRRQSQANGKQQCEMNNTISSILNVNNSHNNNAINFNNLQFDNLSQFSKANVRSIRKDSLSSQPKSENIVNKDNKNEIAYNTMQTEKQFQSYEYFLQDSLSHNPNSAQNLNSPNHFSNINNVYSNTLSNSNNPNTNIPIINSNDLHRKSIPDIPSQFVLEQHSRISNKKLTTQTAPQVYSRTRSFASRKSIKKTNSREILQPSDKNFLQDLSYESSFPKDYSRDQTLLSKKSLRHLKFADDQQTNKQMKKEKDGFQFKKLGLHIVQLKNRYIQQRRQILFSTQ